MPDLHYSLADLDIIVLGLCANREKKATTSVFFFKGKKKCPCVVRPTPTEELHQTPCAGRQHSRHGQKCPALWAYCTWTSVCILKAPEAISQAQPEFLSTVELDQ